MKILIDIGHPGHVHLFKNLAHRLLAEGVDILFTARDKEFELDLLRAEGFRFENFGKHYRSLPGKIWGLFRFDWQMWRCARRFRPDLFISHGSIYAAHAAFLTGKKHLSLEDSGNMEQIRIYRPFTDVILSPEVLPEALGSKQIRYNGYHEIAYLHPAYFTPDPTVFKELGLPEASPYAIIRFVSWHATHDAGHHGLSTADKITLVHHLSQQMRVFISSEAQLSPELEPFIMQIPPERLHHALYYARLVVSEGATIASEAGVLGTPAIYINTIARSYCLDQEQYGLVYNTHESTQVFALVDTILGKTRQSFRDSRAKLLADKIDVTAYLYDFIQQRYLRPQA